MMRSGILAFFIITLQACSFSGLPPPEEHFYRLPQVVAEKSTALFDSIYLKPVIAEGIYNERAILYVKDDTPLELNRYHYHYWINTPARLIHEQFKDYLSVSNLSGQVSAHHTGEQDFELGLRIQNFERITGATNRVLVSLELNINLPGQYSPVFTRTYRMETPAGSSMHDSVSAFGRILNTIFSQMTSDLKNLKKS